MNITFTPFPELTTERLVLRQLKESDAAAIFLLRTDPRVNKYVDRLPPANMEEAKQFIDKINRAISNQESMYWVLTLKNSDSLVGTICLFNISIEEQKGEVGYELLPDYQGRGLMQEALLKILSYGFHTMQLQKVEAYTIALNSRSVKILEHHHFKKVHTTSDDVSPGNDENNGVIYVLTREEYASSITDLSSS